MPIDHRTAIMAAEAKVREVERFISDEITAARAAINERYRQPLRDAQIARSEAYAARDAEAVAAAQDHPMLGKRVHRALRQGGWRSSPTVTQCGIVEIYTRDSKLPENTWRGRFSAGDAIVRILKKDGAPGLKVERLTDEWSPTP